MATLYDVCIVGAGMVGSAAARHATIGEPHQAKPRVCLIGPQEPKVKDITSPRTIFGCHYDEGRTTREIDPSATWSVLASKSIQRYRDIEKASGEKFFSEKGFLSCGTEGSDFLTSLQQVKTTNNIDSAIYLSKKDIREEFPYLNFGEDDVGFYQDRHAGYVSARRMVLAQQTVARKQGCDIIDEVVTEVKELEGGSVMHVKTESGKTVTTRKVLLATNGFTNLNNLLPEGLTLDIRPFAECVAFVEVTDETAQRLSNMPTVVYKGHGADDWRPDAEDIAASDEYPYYLLPPIRYPNGKIYLKLGAVGLHKEKAVLETAQDLKNWYCNPPPQHFVDNLASLITSTVKDIEPISITGDTCVTVNTPSGLPYIDTISPNLTVAVGGNGSAAKSSDEIGRLGIELAMEGKWNSALSRELFKLKTKPIN